MCRFQLATNEKWEDRGGEKQNHPEFHFIVAWGHWARFIHNYFSKGSQAIIWGRLRNRYWKNERGETMRITEVQVDQFIALGKKEVEAQEEEKNEEPPF